MQTITLYVCVIIIYSNVCYYHLQYIQIIDSCVFVLQLQKLVPGENV